MSYSLLVVCEAPDDFALASRLIDRTIEAVPPEWGRGESLDIVREYFGIDTLVAEPAEPFIRWKNLEVVAAHAVGAESGKVRRLQLNIDQFGEAFPAHEDAQAFLKFVRAIQTSTRVRQPDAFVLLRDTDSKERTELRNLNSHPHFKKFPAVVGVPDPETECWLLAGFPHEATEQELKHITEVQQQIDGVHPCRDTHKLRAANEGNDRHPKAVLTRLTNDDPVRLAQCLEAPFAMLRSHGGENGLAAFLDALRNRLITGLYGGGSGE